MVTRPSAAQQPAPVVGLGFGVDTTALDVGPIVQLVRAYLARPDSTVRSRGLWIVENSSGGGGRDIAARFALQGFPATIVGVGATGPGDSVYVVKLLHARSGERGAPASLLALERLYALRVAQSKFGWQLTSAFPRLTREWRTASAGRITFHYAPGQIRDPLRMAQAARFVDSVADLFAVVSRPPIDYYVTASPDEYFRALGLDFFVSPSGRRTAVGGNALPDVGILLSGDPAQGAAYLHELVHMALGSRVRSGFLNEGIAAWLGGSRGRSATQLYGALAEYQRTYPSVTLAALIRGEVEIAHDAEATSDATYASGALIADAVFRRSGVPGLQTLADAPSDANALLRALSDALGLKAYPGDLERWWRTPARRAP
jgi:hypothetical protein